MTLDDFEVDEGEEEGEVPFPSLTLDQFKLEPMSGKKPPRPSPPKPTDGGKVKKPVKGAKQEPLLVKGKEEIYRNIERLELEGRAAKVREKADLKPRKVSIKGVGDGAKGDKALISQAEGSLEGYEIDKSGKPFNTFRLPGEGLEGYLSRAEELKKVRGEEDFNLLQSRAAERSKKATEVGGVEGILELGKSFGTGAGQAILSPLQGFKLAGESLMGVRHQDENEPIPFRPEAAPALSQTFLSKLAQGAGGLVPQMLVGIGTGGVGTALHGALANASQTYNEARLKGKGDEEAREAAFVGGLIGLTESFGLGGQASKLKEGLDTLTRGGVKSWIKESVEEGAQEIIQQGLNNFNAKVLSGYDPSLALTEGLAESGLIGAILGGAVNSPKLSKGGAQGKVTALPEATRVEDALDDMVTPPEFRASATEPLSFAEKREANLRRFVEGSKAVREDGNAIELYHGTQSPIPIRKIDFSKLDPDALYGPGFYMTQDSEVAAGEGGYALTKGYSPFKSLQEQKEWARTQPEFENMVASYMNSGMPRGNAEALVSQDLYGQSALKSAPHSYKLIANIKNPFDIDAELPANEVDRILDRMVQDTNPTLAANRAKYPKLYANATGPVAGEDIYNELVTAYQNRAKVNQVLLDLGYDGITHIGGFDQNVVYKHLDSKSAEEAAKVTGGEVTRVDVNLPDITSTTSELPPGWSIDPNSYGPGEPALIDHEGHRVMSVDSPTEVRIYSLLNNLGVHPDRYNYPEYIKKHQAILDKNSPPKYKYGVRGHRVWIAFKPEQVKSATGNQGTFDVNSPRISESVTEIPNLAELEARAQQAGKDIILTSSTREVRSKEADEIKNRLMTLDPSLPEFETLSRKWIDLTRTITDAEGVEEIVSWNALKDHISRINLHHEGDTQELWGLLGPTIQAVASLPAKDSPAIAVAKGRIEPGEFTFIPSQGSTDTPVLAVPSYVFNAINQSGSGGVNLAVRNFPYLLNSIRQAEKAGTLSQTQAKLAIAELLNYKDFLEQSGINSFSLLNSEVHPINFQPIIHHETFHAGQEEVLTASGIKEGLSENELKRLQLTDLHSPEFVEKNQFLRTLILESPFAWSLSRQGEDLDNLAMEAAAYIAGGQYGIFSAKDLNGNVTWQASTGEAIEYLMDYISHLVDNHGVEAVNRLKQTANLRGNIYEAISLAHPGLDAESTIDAKPGRATNFSPASGNVSPISPSQLESGGSEGAPSNPPPPNSQAYEPSITDDGNVEVLSKFIQLIPKEDYDPTLPPSKQIIEALKNGKINPESFRSTFSDLDVDQDWEEFILDLEDTYSQAGRTLQRLSALQSFYRDLMKDDPELAKKLVPLRTQIIKNLKDLEATALGRSWYHRQGDLIRKMALGQVSTAFVNAWTTMGRIPLDLVSEGVAGYTVGYKEGVRGVKAGTLSLGQVAEKARNQAHAAIQPVLQTILALNPRQLGQIIARRSPTEYKYYDDVVGSLEKYFPEYHSKLHGLSSDITKYGKVPINVITETKGMISKLKDPKLKSKLETRLKVIEGRDKFSKSLLGKIEKGANWIYDIPLIPSNFQEYFFRRPYFVGALKHELYRRGFELDDIIKQGTFSSIPPEALQTAIDKALTFTYAYDPKADAKGTIGIERASHHIIKGINMLGPLGTLVEMFPRALYNGAKFWYEYSPLGAFNPAFKLFNERGQDEVDYQAYHRLAQAGLGTVMYATALGLRELAGGPEWWQIKTGRKTKDGRPIYLDVRRYQPFSGFLWLADTTLRLKEDRALDKKFGEEAMQVLAGSRRGAEGSGMVSGLIQAMGDYFQDTEVSPETKQALKAGGQFLSLPLTPLLNIRDLYAQFSEEENVKKDLKDTPLLGPSIDKIPYYRRKLPNLTSSTEPSPIELSLNPGVAQFTGIKLVKGLGFAGSEWQRLGLAPHKFISRDPDTLINAKQNELFVKLMDQLGDKFAEDPIYQSLNDRHKAAKWEFYIHGDGQNPGLSSLIKEQALTANPREAMRRGLLEKMPGRLQRRANGLDDMIKSLPK